MTLENLVNNLKNRSEAIVIVMANGKGGCGKTTIATSLASGLELAGAKVLLLDTDRQPLAKEWRLKAVDQDHESQMPFVEAFDNILIREKIQKEKQNYDVIVVDTAGNIGYATDMVQKIAKLVVGIADFVLMPMEPTPLSIEGSREMFSMIEQIWDLKGVQSPKLGICINGVRPGTSMAHEVEEYITQNYGIKPLAKIAMREDYRKSFINGSSVYQLENKEGIKEMNALIDKILSQFFEE